MLVKRKPNDLIPKFLNRFDLFTKDVQTRLKLSTMLNEFNTKLNKNFLSFVNLSHSRYKSVKSGNALDTILCNQKLKYNQIADQIKTDDFYHNDDIRNEKDKIEKNINNKKNTEEIREIRDKIKQSAQDMLASNLKERNNEPKPGGFIANFITGRQYGGAMKTKRELKMNLNQVNDSVSFSDNEKERRIITQNTQFVNEVMKEDQKIVKTEIDDYVKHLDLVKKEAIKGEDKKTIKLLNEHKKFFITDKIKMLNYQEEERESVIKQKPKDISIDIKKVMKYTKRGKRMKWGVDYSGKQQSTSPSKDTTHYATSYHPNLKTEISDTLHLVKTEAENCLFLDEMFYQKRHQLNKYISDEAISLPQITNTEQNIQTNTFSSFKVRNSSLLGNNTFNNTQREGNKKNIGEKFKTIYNVKTQEWKKKDLEREELDKVKAEELKHTYNFLKEVKNQPRKTQLFVDGYSSRNNSNEQIIEFSNALGKKFYNKKKLNCEINHYIREKESYKMEMEEQMKQKHEELIREAELEEERKKAMFNEFKQRIRNEDVGDDDFVKLGDKDEVIKPFKKFNPSSTGYETDNEYEKFLQFKQVFINKMEKRHNMDEPRNDEISNASECRRANKLVTYANRPKKTSILDLDQEQLIRTLKKQLTKTNDTKFAVSGKKKVEFDVKIPNAISVNHINYYHLNN